LVLESASPNRQHYLFQFEFFLGRTHDFLIYA